MVLQYYAGMDNDIYIYIYVWMCYSFYNNI
jgi:hypothetical protein